MAQHFDRVLLTLCQNDCRSTLALWNENVSPWLVLLSFLTAVMFQLLDTRIQNVDQAVVQFDHCSMLVGCDGPCLEVFV